MDITEICELRGLGLKLWPPSCLGSTSGLGVVVGIKTTFWIF